MKVKDLIEKLKSYEDFELEAVYVDDPKPTDKFMNLLTYKVVGVGDVGHSSKLVLLELELA